MLLSLRRNKGLGSQPRESVKLLLLLHLEKGERKLLKGLSKRLSSNKVCQSKQQPLKQFEDTTVYLLRGLVMQVRLV